MRLHKSQTRWSIVAIMLFIGHISYGQEVSSDTLNKGWTLEQCIRYALENNLSIKSQSLSLKVQENTYTASQLGLLPSITADASHSTTFGRALDQTQYTFVDNTVKNINGSISANMVLFDGLQKQNTIRKNRFDLLATSSEFDKLKNDISLNITAAYLQILLDEELVRINENQLALTVQQVEQTRKLVDAGKVVMGNLLDIQAQAASEELQVITAQNKLSLSKLQLIQLLDLKDTTFKIIMPQMESFEISAVVSDLESVYPVAEANLPQIKTAKFRAESAKTSIRIAQGQHYPQLSLSASYGSSYSDIRERLKIVNGTPVVDGSGQPVYEKYPFFDQFKDNKSLGVYVRLSVPIFSGFSTRFNISSSKANYHRAEIALEVEKNNLYKEIQQASADAVAAYKRYVASNKSVETLGLSFDYTQNRFNLGLINSLDYNTAKNKLVKAQSDLLQARFEYIFKTKILDFYKGNPIKL